MSNDSPFVARGQLSGYQVEIFATFSTLGDYLWKSPQFVDAEHNLEIAKLAGYFPDHGTDEERAEAAKLRSIRASLEIPKLKVHFPRYIAEANLFLALAVFEQHLLELSRIAESDADASLAEIRGNGVERYYRFLRGKGVIIERLSYFHQIQAAVLIRNSLLHASGDLELSKDAKRIGEIVSGKLYMDAKRRSHSPNVAADNTEPEVEIYENSVRISFYFPLRVANYCREFLLDLTAHIPKSLNR